MSAVGFTRRGFLERLVAAGAAAVAAPALRALDFAEEVGAQGGLLQYMREVVPVVERQALMAFWSAEPIFEKLRAAPRNARGKVVVRR